MLINLIGLFLHFSISVPILPEFFYTQYIINDVANGTANLNSSETLEKLLSDDKPLQPLIPTTTAESYNSTTITTETNSSCLVEQSEEYLLSENFYIGILFASKPFVQIVCNMVVGPLVDKHGFDIPMQFGYFVMFMSALG